MWRLFKQWRYVRWVYKELLGHEKKQNMVGFGQAVLLTRQAAIDEYKKKKLVFASGVKIRRILEQCIADGYIVDQGHPGPSLRISVSKGENFKPVFSGLILGELGLLSPLWAAFSGGLLVAIVWFLHAVHHVL